MDSLTLQERSERMALIPSKDTAPEMMVRRLAHGLGFRYRLHAPDLPGKPDLVFRSRRKVIFVHGCFWHRHQRCGLARLPKSRLAFWLPKLEGNKRRDATNQKRLKASGWRCMTIWECELRDAESVARKVRGFLDA